MWIFTKIGFFSAVQDKDNSNQIMVRARCLEDIENLVEYMVGFGTDEPEIHDSIGTDYKYRIFIPRKRWALLLVKLGNEIDYTNFKNHVHGDHDRDYAYLQCWNAMFQFQESKL
ncbi:MAG: hypothetical protein U9Q07_14785 [Planctomycetota bacterium]|nr:hypothetical protein [Planctomycetota bacterium]